MRPLVLVTLLVTAALAGCLKSDDAPLPGATTEDPDDADRADLLNETLADQPQFCADEDTGIPSGPFARPCDYWDLDYHEYVVYNVDTTVFDVVIVPPAGMTTPDQIATSRLAIQAWSDGIEALAAPWLQDAFQMNVYAVGIDIPSVDAIADPDIIVISSSAEFVFGIGLEPKQLGCQILGLETVQDHGGHEHDGNRIVAQDCTGIGYTCFALNVGSLDPRGLYDLIAHEVGHCLGAGHVGDALDFRARYAPIEDIMSYQANPEQVHCVSNLNVRVLEGVYAHLLDRPAEEHLPRGSYHAMSPLDYVQVDCENPPGM